MLHKAILSFPRRWPCRRCAGVAVMHRRFVGSMKLPSWTLTKLLSRRRSRTRWCRASRDPRPDALQPVQTRFADDAPIEW